MHNHAQSYIFKHSLKDKAPTLSFFVYLEANKNRQSPPLYTILMKKKLSVFFIIFFYLFSASEQEKCETTFVPDTLTAPGASATLSGQSVEATMKNLSKLKLFKSDDGRIFLRIIITEKFYFNKVDVLEIQSGTKSYYAKDTKQYKLSRSQGQFTIEIFRNYVWTLKELGITALVFGPSTTDFTKQDTKEVKKIATCVFETIADKK